MKKNGFTLVELVAILVIIGVLAMVSVPIVLHYLNDGKKNAFADSVDGIVRAVELDSAKKDFTKITYQVERGDVINLKTKEVLKLEGGSEEAGKIIVNQEGTISYAIHNDSWCAIKTESEREQIIKKYVEGDCNLSS